MKPYPWIKLSTDFFDDPKILRLQTYPEKFFLLVFWIKLVLLSLRRGDGLLLIDDELPYSISDFVTMFGQTENTIRMALAIFEKLNMIVVQSSAVGEIIGVHDFIGFNDIESLELDRLKNRKKQADFRERQNKKLLGLQGINEVEKDPQKSITGANIEENNRLLTGDSPVSNQKVTGQNRNRTEEDKNRTDSVVLSVGLMEIEELKGVGFSLKDTQKLIKQYGITRVREVVEYSKKKGAKNIPAYSISVLKNFHGPVQGNSPMKQKQAFDERKDDYHADLETWSQLDYQMKCRLLKRKDLGNIGTDHNFPEPIWLKKALSALGG